MNVEPIVLENEVIQAVASFPASILNRSSPTTVDDLLASVVESRVDGIKERDHASSGVHASID